jgi:transcriptional regulator GlxA family with amidase domain
MRGDQLDIHAFHERITLVREVDEWIDRDASESVHVIDICRALGVPLRTLQRAFHETVGMGPAHYVAAKKLGKARAALLAADPTLTSVTEIAFKFGFWELGRFAATYRQMFGEKPSETLHRRRH